jgi:hypothetical protein
VGVDVSVGVGVSVESVGMEALPNVQDAKSSDKHASTVKSGNRFITTPIVIHNFIVKSRD